MSELPLSKITAGDCLKILAGWPEGSVDLIFADPPYNIGYNYDKYDDKRSDEEYIDWTRDWITACSRVLSPTGSFYVLIGDEYAAETRLILKKLEQEKKLAFRNWIIWHYTFGQNCKIKFNRSHAHLFYCVGSGIHTHPNAKLVKDPPFTFNREAIAVPSARQTTYKDARANPTGKMPDDTWYLRPQEVEGSYFRPDEDTWYQSRLCGTFSEREQWHPCQLPEALLERVVKLSSSEQQVVFDPFTGSGTTLAVAARLKRKWLGTELSKDYAKRAQKRIELIEAGEEPAKKSRAAGKKVTRKGSSKGDRARAEAARAAKTAKAASPKKKTPSKRSRVKKTDVS